MKEKKKKFFEDLFEDIFSDFENLSRGFTGGYSISVISSGGKTKVYVKADKNTDVTKLRRELEEMYPGAEITIEGGKPSIEEGPTYESPKKKSMIEVIDERKLEEEK